MSVPMPICRTMRFNAIAASLQIRLNLPSLMAAGEARAGVCRVVNREQALCLDGGVTLRRRQTGVPQQFLDRPQIAAGAEEMGGKAVPQGVRGLRFGETQIPTNRLHLALYKTRVEWPAPCADKERPIRRQRMGAGGEIISDRLAHHRQNR